MLLVVEAGVAGAEADSPRCSQEGSVQASAAEVASESTSSAEAAAVAVSLRDMEAPFIGALPGGGQRMGAL